MEIPLAVMFWISFIQAPSLQPFLGCIYIYKFTFAMESCYTACDVQQSHVLYSKIDLMALYLEKYLWH